MTGTSWSGSSRTRGPALNFFAGPVFQDADQRRVVPIRRPGIGRIGQDLLYDLSRVHGNFFFLGEAERDGDVLPQEPDGKTGVERPGQNELGELGHGCVASPRALIEDLDHSVRIQAEPRGQDQRLAGRYSRIVGSEAL